LDEEDNKMQMTQAAALTVISMRNYDEERRRTQLIEEIEQFKSEIATWGITMEALVKNSPKHKGLREAYKKVVALVMRSSDIMQTIRLKNYFPIKAISEISELPQKKLERARIYIILALIIKTGDYDLLGDYIEFAG